MSESSLARWLHVSDFHFREGDSYDRDVVLGALLRSLPDLVRRSGPPDFIVATGDIGYSGRAEEYVNATAFFDKLLEETGVTKSNLIVVPGNHDVDRKKGRGLSRTILSQDADEYFDPSENLIHITMRQAAFVVWYNSYFEGIRKFCTNSTCGDRIEIVTARGIVSVVPLNSAIFSFDDNDHGKLWIGRRCLDRVAFDSDPGPCELRIVAMHHPLNWLSATEAANVKSALRTKFDCVLSGHLHETDAEQVAGIYGGAVHLAAGATYQTRVWPNTAMMVDWLGSELLVTPFRYEDCPVEHWTIDPSLFPVDDFRGRFEIDRLTEKRDKAISQIQPSGSRDGHSGSKSALAPLSPDQAQSDFDQELFLSPGKKVLFAEPRLMTRPQEQFEESSERSDPVSIEEIVNSSESFMIDARSEYGGSNLCRLLALRIANSGAKVFRKDARDLPNYRKKLEIEFPFIALTAHPATIVIDNFDIERDERLIKELISTGWFCRFIVISPNRSLRPAKIIDMSSLSVSFQRLYLWPLSRGNVREMATAMFSSGDESFISTVVNKVYGDLLGLCIPLTPSNVIMYLRILDKEGEFHPINRVDIVGRYISELLRKPSDAYVDTFNTKNKMDLISAFTYQLYLDNIGTFDEKYWLNFCSRYKAETLAEFDSKNLLIELMETRILVSFMGGIFHKYSFFYSFFLGRYIASRSKILDKFLADEEYLRLRNVVDVITGLSSDNTRLVQILTERLDQHLAEFESKYVKASFDPLAEALWPADDEEEERLWKPIAAQIEAGPRSVKEIDVIKTSVTSEAKTADQEVRLSKFTQLESALFECNILLMDALRNSDDVSGVIKLAAFDTILRARHVIFQIGALCAPQLAAKSFFQWGGLAFLNFQVESGIEADSPQAKLIIVDNLSYTVARRTTELIGSRKLSGVFKARAKQIDKLSFLEIMTFHCILAAKGPAWEETVSDLIMKADKQSYFLSMMLDALTDDLTTEILQLREREALKRLLSTISAKRAYKKQLPGAKAISKRLRFLQKKGTFDRSATRGEDESAI